MIENTTTPDAVVRRVLDDAFAKYREGEKKHGVLDIDADPRNFLVEAERELLDAIVYACIEIARIRELNKKLNYLGVAMAEMSIKVHTLDAAGFEKAVEKEVVPALQRLAGTVKMPNETEKPTL